MLSIWEKQHFLQYDYAIVGGGILGLSIAAQILEKQPQMRVAVLEKGIFPTGASTKNAGFACFGSPTEIQHDIALIGESEALQLVENKWKGLQILRKRLGDKALDFEQNGGFELIFEPQTSIVEQLPYLNDLLQPIFGEAIFSNSPSDLLHFGFNTSKVKYLLKNTLEGQIDTGWAMKNLWLYVQKLGAMLFTQTQVTHINTTQDEAELSCKQSDKLEEEINLKATKVVVCTNAFLSQMYPELGIQAGRGQVIVTQPIPDLAIKGTFHFEEGFYYFRNYQNRIILGGGRNQDFETENTTEFSPNPTILADLKQKLAEIILPQQDVQVDYTWAGIMGFSADKKPIMQEMDNNIWVVFACNGMGVALSSFIADDFYKTIT